MENEKELFARVPHAVVDSGLLSKMTKAEIKIYLVLCRHAHFRSADAFPNYKTIGEESGINKNQIGMALRNLVTFGLISKRRAPKALNFKNVYKIMRNPEIEVPISPNHSDKKNKYVRGEGGKFKVSPNHSESGFSPNHSESHTSPNSPDKKDIETYLNRDSFKEGGIKISKETIEEYRKLKGDSWVQEEIKKGGYVVVDEDGSEVKVTEGVS